MLTTISTENQYNLALEAIETYLLKGSNALSTDEKNELLRLSILIKAYEQQVYPMPLSTPLENVYLVKK